MGGNSNTRSDPSYCCSKCTGCMEDSSVAGKVASLCRGGHGIHSHDSNHPIDAIVSSVTPFNLPLNAWKVIFQFFLTALNVACWLIPLKSKKISENKLGLSLANAFSGGVFLSLAFGHLIPECVHGFEAYNEATPFLLVLAGYLLIFFIEKVAFDAHDILHEMADDHHDHTAMQRRAEVTWATAVALPTVPPHRRALQAVDAVPSFCWEPWRCTRYWK